MTGELPHVAIVGGGFAGLRAAQALGGERVRVTLIDRRNHHLFQPLLYQVATAGLATTDIAVPLRQVVRHQANTTVLLAEVQSVDVAHKQLRLSTGTLEYDHLIVATGVVNHWFGHDEWSGHALGLKSCEDALLIRRRILLAFEAAERVEPAERGRLLTFVVIGGGPTGVELAGALSEIARVTLTRDFRRFEPAQARIVLLEGSARLLGGFPEQLSRSAERALRGMGVDVRIGVRVDGVDAAGVRIGAERIEAATVLWAAGVRAAPLLGTLGCELDRMGRVRVEPDLGLPGHPEVSVVGDAAAVAWGETLVPGMAPGAMQMGRHAARNVVLRLRGQPARAFRYRHKGLLATIGRSSAVAQLGRLRFAGLVAWLLWAWVHVFYLISFRNRCVVMFEWVWLYFTRQRGARVILEAEQRGPGDP